MSCAKSNPIVYRPIRFDRCLLAELTLCEAFAHIAMSARGGIVREPAARPSPP